MNNIESIKEDYAIGDPIRIVRSLGVKEGYIVEPSLKSRLPDHYLLIIRYLTLYCSVTFCNLENILYLYT